MGADDIDPKTRADLQRWFGKGGDKSEEAPAKPEPQAKDLLADKKALEEVVDAATRAELERWFGLPSFTELAEKVPEEERPEVVAARARREQATANVDPHLLEALNKRFEPDKLVPVRTPIKMVLRNDVARIDLDRVESMAAAIADPREREISEELRDDLNDCTPQALLRDLHRPESDFEKTFEVVDMAAEQRFDIVEAVDSAMKANWKLPPLEVSPVTEARDLYRELRSLRKLPTKDIPAPNRRHKE